MDKILAMTFEEFAMSVKPSGAVNRYAPLGSGKEVFTYSVYMNGPLMKEMDPDLCEFEFNDEMVHALTSELGLDRNSFRDNLKVAELSATRRAWLEAVLVNTLHRPEGITPQLNQDYELLEKGIANHPWIQKQLEEQKALSAKLKPTLDRASLSFGDLVKDIPPEEVSVGKIVFQNKDFTIQETQKGERVTHENRRLNNVPELDSEVTVSYYRGSGQVVESLENLKVSKPFIESETNDLAVMIKDGKGREQVVLFNSVSGFEKFVKEHGMDTALVHEAMDIRAAKPKPLPAVDPREKTSDVYVEEDSGCLAIQYREKGKQLTYSAIFSSAAALEALAAEYNLTAKDVESAKHLESQMALQSPERRKQSEAEVEAKLKELGYAQIEYAKGGKVYIGKVIVGSEGHVGQDLGRKQAVIHDCCNMDKRPAIGDSLTVKYENDRGRVTKLDKGGQDLGR